MVKYARTVSYHSKYYNKPLPFTNKEFLQFNIRRNWRISCSKMSNI